MVMAVDGAADKLGIVSLKPHGLMCLRSLFVTFRTALMVKEILYQNRSRCLPSSTVEDPDAATGL